MIQQVHLTAWQAHAPWDKRSKIEQDLRLSRGIAAIFSDAVLAEHLAMRGGTVLHKGYLAPAARYSEDIDLVLIKPMDKDDALEARLRAALTREDTDEICSISTTPRSSGARQPRNALWTAREPSKRSTGTSPMKGIIWASMRPRNGLTKVYESPLSVTT
jgi:hypothetical protein